MGNITKKIVLIEDDIILSNIIAEELTDAGFTVTQAYNGKDGIEVVKRELPGLVLLDLLMPIMNGYEVLERLKSDKDEVVKNIPVIVLTMLSVDDDIQKSLELGAIDHLVKSQESMTRIVRRVKRLFQARQSI